MHTIRKMIMTSYKINVTVKMQKNSMTLWHNINTISNKINTCYSFETKTINNIWWINIKSHDIWYASTSTLDIFLGFHKSFQKVIHLQDMDSFLC